MEVLKQNVGMEVDAKKLKVSFQILRHDLSKKILGSKTFGNNGKGFESLHSWIEKKKVKEHPVHITMEATGVYYENVAYYLSDTTDYKVHVLLPSVCHAFAKSLNQKSKTDELDAKMLAQLGLERKLGDWHPPSQYMRDLKKLNRERLQLVREKTLVSNQLHAMEAAYDPQDDAINRYKQRIAFIAQQIKEIEKSIRRLVDQDLQLKERITNVCTSPGLGFITVVGVVAETQGFVLIRNRNQLVSYAGYDVVKKESGTSVRSKGKISKKGNSYIRQMLYLPALSAVRHCEHHKNQYIRIVSKTNIKMKGNVAIQRKLLLLIYSLFTKNEAYNPDYPLMLQKKLYPIDASVKHEISEPCL